MKSIIAMLQEISNLNDIYISYVLGKKLSAEDHARLNKLVDNYKITDDSAAEERMHEIFATYYEATASEEPKRNPKGELVNYEPVKKLNKFIQEIKKRKGKDENLELYYQKYLKRLENPTHAFIEKLLDEKFDSTAAKPSMPFNKPVIDEAKISKQISDYANTFTIEVTAIARNSNTTPAEKLKAISAKLSESMVVLAEAKIKYKGKVVVSMAIQDLITRIHPVEIVLLTILENALKDNKNDLENFLRIIRSSKILPLNINSKSKSDLDIKNVFDKLQAEYETERKKITYNFSESKLLPLLDLLDEMNSLNISQLYEKLERMQKAYEKTPDNTTLPIGIHLLAVDIDIKNIALNLNKNGDRVKCRDEFYAAVNNFYSLLVLCDNNHRLIEMLNIQGIWKELLGSMSIIFDPAIKTYCKELEKISIPRAEHMYKVYDYILSAELFEKTMATIPVAKEKKELNFTGDDVYTHAFKRAWTKPSPAAKSIKISDISDPKRWPEKILIIENTLQSIVPKMTSDRRDKLINAALKMQQKYLASFEYESEANDLINYCKQYIDLAGFGTRLPPRLMEYYVAVIELTNDRYFQLTGKGLQIAPENNPGQNSKPPSGP